MTVIFEMGPSNVSILVKSKLFLVHPQECPEQKIQCDACQMFCKRKEMIQHIKEGDSLIVGCEFGWGDLFQRRLEQEHLATCTHRISCNTCKFMSFNSSKTHQCNKNLFVGNLILSIKSNAPQVEFD